MNGVRKHTRDVGMTFPTPSSTEAREEDSDVTSWSEENIEEKRLLTNYLGDKRLRKNEQSCREGRFLIPCSVTEKPVNLKSLAMLRFFVSRWLCVDPRAPAPPGQIFAVSGTIIRVMPVVKQSPGHPGAFLTAQSPENPCYAHLWGEKWKIFCLS